MCHARSVKAHLGKKVSFEAYDLLSLFAFVHPAISVVPTPQGLADALKMDRPDSPEEEARILFDSAFHLLGEMQARPEAQRFQMAEIARFMAHGGWSWGATVLAALDAPLRGKEGRRLSSALHVWERLPEWSEHAPQPPAGMIDVSDRMARRRLTMLLERRHEMEGRRQTEDRPQQADYASAVSEAFRAPTPSDPLSMVLAEAGTGIGKTLGYIAPASVWAQENAGSVWLSTYTRNLQRQLDGELDVLFPDKQEKHRKVVVRKGRENYLCLLNYEDALNDLTAGTPPTAEALGLMARWIGATRDGDLVGGDFPGWLPDLLGHERTTALADRRGECIFSACQHYHRCFIERVARRAKRADIVVANHALVLIRAAMGGLLDDASAPTRYVFDEGHHLFHAADDAFSAHLSGWEGADLRRWILGAESKRSRSRARGLKRRTEEVLSGDSKGLNLVEDICYRATCLPSDGWRARMREEQAAGAAEKFLLTVAQTVQARQTDRDSPYSFEAEVHPVADEMLQAALQLYAALEKLKAPLSKLVKHLGKRLAKEAKDLSESDVSRMDSVMQSITRRALLPVSAWMSMLESLETTEEAEGFVDWLAVERQFGETMDVGLYRHHLDPMQPFAEAFAPVAHGMVVTSATLQDRSGDTEKDWQVAEAISGAGALLERGSATVSRAAVPSPFDYGKQAKIFLVKDVNFRDMDRVSAAFKELFTASGGGGLGIFTAIQRLRAVQQKIAAPLEEAGIRLLAQHVDGMDTSTLIDIFRDDRHSCLLGTDAVRDGVDVPGDPLRLIVFERVPWARASLLHKARREAYGKGKYDDQITRLKLAQAFGRLIRRADDKGAFVMLDSRMPSRLLTAFPPDVEIVKSGLAETIAGVQEFLSES